MKDPDTGYPHVRAERPSGAPARPGSSPHPFQPRRCAGTAPLARAQRVTSKGGELVKQANYYAVTKQGRVKPQAIPPSTTPLQIGQYSDHWKSQTNKEKCTSWSVQPASPSVEHFNSSAAPTKPSKAPRSHKSSFNRLPYPPHSAITSPLNCSSFRDVLSCCRVPLMLRVCVALIALLLLLAGDVERNPGPTELDELLETVDNTTILSIDDWDQVNESMKKLRAKWFEIGIGLKVDKDFLEELDDKNLTPERALIRTLGRWLEHYDEAKLGGKPTWRMLARIAGKYQMNMAREIADNHHSTGSSRGTSQASHTTAPASAHLRGHTVLTMLDLASLLATLSVIAFDWRNIGIELGFNDSVLLDKVNRKVLGIPLEALTELLTMWLLRLDPPPTLVALADVIGGPVIRNTALANSLRQMQPSTLLHQQSLLHASTTDDVVAGYADQMRGYYGTTIPQCFSLTWPPPPTRKVFNLSMISHKQYNYGRGNDELVRLLHHGNVDDLVTKESTIKLKDLFDLNKADRKVVLIEGAPGAGKSTLAWHICQKWKAGELFQKFKLVVFVQLRDPTIQSAKSLADLFPSQLKGQARDVISRMETRGGEGLLFVLDGWDEFPPGLSGNHNIENLICTPSAIGMPSSTLLITSRPIASGDLHQYASSRVETIGFKRTERDLYFKEALQNNPDSIRELNGCLKERPVIKASCYLPLNIVIVIHLFLSLGNCLPRTLHGVFLQLVIHCIVRHIMKQQANDSELLHISSLNDLPSDMQTQLSHICAMAYHGVMENKVTFSEEDLKLFNLPTNISTLSLIQVVVSFMPYRSRSYNFLHLSVQELLTAYYISKLPPKEQVKIFRKLFGQPRFAAVFQYYAAFTKLQTEGIRDIIVSVTQQRNKDLLLTLLHCLYEAQDSALCQFVASQLNGKLDFSKKSLSPVDCIAVGYFVHQCAAICPMTAKLSMCSLDSYKLELLGKELKRPNQAAEFKICIELKSNSFDGNLTRFIASELIASASEDVSTVISKLDLSGNPIQDVEDGLAHLCQALTTNTSLVELNLSECKLHAACGPALRHMLETNKTLTSLALYNNQRFSVHNVTGFAEGLRSNHTLKYINLGFCGIHDAGMKSLGDSLMVNDSLEELDLSVNTISPEAACRLSDMLKHNSTLKKLDVTWCTLADEAVKSLASSLEVNSTLEELDLGDNPGLTDTTLVALGESLKRNTGLKILKAGTYFQPMNKTTANGWGQFVQCLKHNHSLQLLRTPHDKVNKLDMEDVNTVRREMNLPELQHQHYQ